VKTSGLGAGEGPLCASASVLDWKSTHPITMTQATMAMQNQRLEERLTNERLPFDAELNFNPAYYMPTRGV
jgi:hypothetical protein